MTTPQRTHDLIVFGATGFTGRLVCEHLLRRGEDAGSWAMAGRSAEKLAAVAAEIGATDVPQIVADSTDPASIAAMAASTKVVITTVGPYAQHGSEVVAACAAAGTDYVDLTGEPHFVRRMIDQHHETAVETGARIVHSCGFDSIPSDLGTLVAQTTMQEQHGTAARRVHLRVKAIRGGASGGTIASGVGMLAEAAADREVARVLKDPYSLLPAGERIGPSGAGDRVGPGFDRDFGQWVAPFVMEAINARIVRRSNAVMGYPWTREFAYDEAMLVGNGLAGRAKATALAATFGLGALSLSNDALRGVADRFLPDAGTGPDAAAREAGFFDLRILAEHPTDRSKDVHVKVLGDKDPGYGSTSQMLGEAGLTLAHGESEVGGGSWTPASALGHALVARLEAHAGVTFTVL